MALVRTRDRLNLSLYDYRDGCFLLYHCFLPPAETKKLERDKNTKFITIFKEKYSNFCESLFMV